MSTDQLVTRMADGDVSALATLFDRYGHSGYALALRRCGDPERAERIVRQTFLELWADPARTTRPGAAVLHRIWTAAAGVEPGDPPCRSAG